MGFFDNLVVESVEDIESIRRRGGSTGRTSEFLDTVRSLQPNQRIVMSAVEAANADHNEDSPKWINPESDDAFETAVSRLRSRINAKRDNEYVVGFAPRTRTNPEDGTFIVYRLED